AMPSSVPLWAQGFAAEIRDDAAGLGRVLERSDKNPLGSAAGYGTPGLAVDREATRAQLGFAVVHEPGTAVQLSRGKAEAQLIFEITLLMQDLGRLAADVVLFATAEFSFVELAPAFTTGSSIMPQKRNPDVFELVRGRSASAHGCLVEALGICAKLPSGYHRDLQLAEFPAVRRVGPRGGAPPHPPAGARGAALPSRGDPPRSLDPRRRGGQPPRGERGHPVPRGLPARRREAQTLAGTGPGC